MNQSKAVNQRDEQTKPTFINQFPSIPYMFFKKLRPEFKCVGYLPDDLCCMSIVGV